MSDGQRQIVVLVKQVHDINEITIDPVTRKPILGPTLTLNTYDRYALAAGIALREQGGGTVTVVTAGPPSAREVLLRCLASGADEGVLIDLPDHNGIDTLSLATILAGQVRALGAEIVVAGQSSEDYEAAQVGPQVAELLGWPHVSLVTQATIDGDRLSIRRDAERTKEDMTVSLPAVLVVLSGRDGEQRHPTLRGMMQAKKKIIPVITPQIPDRVRLEWGEPVAEVRESTGTILQGVPADDAARQLVGWLKDRKLA